MDSVTVGIDGIAAGTTAYYTTNGTDPTVNGAVYTAPFTLTQSATVSSAVYDSATGLWSAITTAAFTVTPGTPGHTGNNSSGGGIDDVGTGYIYSTSGGTARSADGRITVTVPVGAITLNTTINIQKVTDTTSIPAGAFMFGSEVYEITLSEGSIKSGAFVKLSFDYNLPPGANVEQVNAYYWNGTKWVCVGGQVVNGRLEVNVSHFTNFAVMTNTKLPVLTDIKSHWAYNEIKRLVGMEVVNSYSDSTYRPEETLTRAEFARLIVQSMGWSAKSGDLSFTDAADFPAWAGGYIATAVEKGVIKGYEDNTFRAGQPVSRSEITAMIIRAMAKGSDAVGAGKLGFNDTGSVPAWARGYVSTAVDNGIVVGKPGNMFDPIAGATRAESAAMVVRMMNNLGI